MRQKQTASDVTTQTNSHTQNKMVGDLKQLFLKKYLKGKFGLHFPPLSLRTRLGCLTLAGFQ